MIGGALAAVQAMGALKEGEGGGLPGMGAEQPAAPDVVTITPTVTMSGRLSGGDFIVGGQGFWQSALPWVALVILGILLFRRA